MIFSHHSRRFCALGAKSVYTSCPRCLSLKGYMTLSPLSVDEDVMLETAFMRVLLVAMLRALSEVEVVE